MKARNRQLAFVLASLCVVAALAAVTIQSLRLERNELRSRAIAEHEASVRLVLWRMDSMLAPILAREAATPYYYYRPFFEASRTNSLGFDPLITLGQRPVTPDRSEKMRLGQLAEIPEALLPSPLLQSDSKLVNLYFEVDEGGLRSPQAPEGAFRALAESNFISAYQIEDNRRRLNELQSVWTRSQVATVEQGPADLAERAASDVQTQTLDGAREAAALESLGPAPTAGPPQSASDASGARTTAGQIASQQVGNDYAQRAQVAANSKLTQLEADRMGRQWRRTEENAADDPETVAADASAEADVPAEVEVLVDAEVLAEGEVLAEREASAEKAGSAERAPDAARYAAGAPAPASEGSPATAPAESRERSASAAPPTAPPTTPPTAPPTATPLEPLAAVSPTSSAPPSSDAASTRARSRDETPTNPNSTNLNSTNPNSTNPALANPTPPSAPAGAGSGESAATRDGRSDPIQGPLEPRWLTGSDQPTLVLVRQVSTSTGMVTQGLWLNWAELRGALLELAADVFPSASIDPLPGGVANLPAEALNRCLATIPAELRVPDPSIPTPQVVSPVRVALGLAWVVALAAIGASGMALRSATELADRRGQFVTAVTHELRTPLTTFCLYSQMLADGMVRDADAQAQYHATLHRESQRLTRIVESVLEYARLGKRKAPTKADATPIAALLDASVPALRERCLGCGLELVESRDGDMEGLIRVDRATFDRILSNLVDNACKYAVGGEPARVELRASVSASTLEVRVRDFGPGIAPSEAKRIFDPFFRGSAHSDGATPGLGLGLALCRALAREMGGDLSLIQPSGGDAPSTGACFRLVLPRNA